MVMHVGIHVLRSNRIRISTDSNSDRFPADNEVAVQPAAKARGTRKKKALPGDTRDRNGRASQDESQLNEADPQGDVGGSVT